MRSVSDVVVEAELLAEREEVLAVPLDAGLEDEVDEDAMYATLLGKAKTKQYTPRQVTPSAPVVIEIEKEGGKKENVVIDMEEQEEVTIELIKKGSVSVQTDMFCRGDCCGCPQLKDVVDHSSSFASGSVQISSHAHEI